MSKAGKLLAKADSARTQMVDFVARINSLLSRKFGDGVWLTHQEGDGWVVVFNDDLNAAVTPDMLDDIIALPEEDAMELLRQHVL